jgi:hypothetical protein
MVVKNWVVSWTERRHNLLEIRVRDRTNQSFVKNQRPRLFCSAPRGGRSFSAPRDPGAPAPLPTLMISLVVVLVTRVLRASGSGQAE